MRGWIVPPPTASIKTATDYAGERKRKVLGLESRGLLKSPRIKSALLKVHREDFIPRDYRDYAYWEVPLPLPGALSTISCPHSYPLFYEPLGLDQGHRFLEVGTGSGYGAAVAREIVGDDGLVATVEIDPLTHDFARANLRQAGYNDIVLVLGDGGLGYPPEAPYDRIAVTAACTSFPAPLIAQLKPGGRAIAPVLEDGRQVLTVLTKRPDHGVQRESICDVLYVALRGRYGAAAAEIELATPNSSVPA